MSFNIKNSFVSRAIVEDDKQLDTGEKEEEVVIQEQYDPRTLFERLQEQKTLKEEKFAEESRLSNQIKRVDEEEAEYFRTLSDEKEKLEYERKVKEQLELEEYRQAVEARTTVAVPVVAVSKANISGHKLPVKSTTSQNNKKIKGALFVKKKKRDGDQSSDDDEKDDKPKDKKAKVDDGKDKTTIATKPKGSLSLLSDAYGDMSSSDSDSDSD